MDAQQPVGGAGSIKPINRQSIHRICSGQVILDLATAIKELVENALDAGATNIEVRLREYGSALVEVADNGRGVPPADYQALTLKYHTSKITSFDDLSSVSTYGFRGEALSSLCAVSELSVVTRTAEQDAGVRLEYDHEGLLTSRSPAPRAVGTTVAVKDLFKTLPVRHKEFLRNIKREFAKAVSVLQAYALIATHTRIIVTNQPGGKGASRATVLTTAAPAATYEAYEAAAATAAASDGSAGGAAPAPPPTPGSLPTVLAALAAAPPAPGAAAGADPRVAAQLAALRDNVVSVFGGRVAEALEPLVLPQDPETGVRVVGWVSRAGCGLKGDTSRQFFFLNGRPVDLPKAARVLNDSFKSLSSPAHAGSHRPMGLLSVSLPSEEVDVNVTPDKRRVFMAAEDRMCGLLQQSLSALWEPSRCTFAVNAPSALTAGGAGAGGAGGSALVAGGLRGGPQRQTTLSVVRGGGNGATAAASAAAGTMEVQDADAVSASKVAGCRGGGGGGGSQSPAKRQRLSSDTADAGGGDGGDGGGGDVGEEEEEGEADGAGYEGAGAAGGYDEAQESAYSPRSAPGAVAAPMETDAAEGPAAEAEAADEEVERRGAGGGAERGAAAAGEEEEGGYDDDGDGGDGDVQPVAAAPRGSGYQEGLAGQEQPPAAAAAAEEEEEEEEEAEENKEPAVGRTPRLQLKEEAEEGPGPGPDVTAGGGVVGAILGAVARATPPAPAAVLHLAPGQLAALTAARVRHLAAQRKRRRAEEEEQQAAAAAAAEGRRFHSASLEEEAGGAEAAEGGCAGAGGTRAEREAAAERELERVFRKEQFREMRVLGQFNLGFILGVPRPRRVHR
ncbi:hypothetical protein GPECTOR_276g725 [Gonium pectorale]|uniref:DNA mismatch repair protein S5 domain-containing protein n=1 Tax=Gonium pectorale TaxID=33097 RepID=A0A150FW24_GONPE|nr:hypothetical protein GPECTOR_276g725 [Gonium pectorale]|eukprot:KXZ41811.1 hypothetical protein GPECTOR_276g725 [Gonium pectorale]